ncbi:hypothetical protein KA005_13050 [bacterium]|nr:hypothetical protein [bacterium]
MNLPAAYDNSEAIATGCLAKIMTSETRPTGWLSYGVGNEIRPSDLYCYLYSKFGAPNGLQNLLRNDSSDNLIHWEWVLACEQGFIFIQGLNLRTEFNFMGKWDVSDTDKDDLINHIKKDFVSFGKEMSKIRADKLEDWDVFVNPYQQLRSSVNQLKNDLDGLGLEPSQEKLDNPTDSATFKKFETNWNDLMVKYNRGIGLAMSLNIMIPVLAESFVNFVIFVLCRPDIKKNQRLFSSFVRSNIDVRVQSLHINCIGFDKPVDWGSDECKAYNSIVNKRNDLLHGNITLDKLKISEVFFNKNIPVFKEYRSLWQHSIGTSLDVSGFATINAELNTINEFIQYVLSCMSSTYKENVEFMSERRDLGVNKGNSRIGVLLPDHIADFGINTGPNKG